MNENEYITLSDDQLLLVEQALDDMIDADQPLDYESGDGMLTILCGPSQSPVILSRQRPLKQIWVAARSGGFHLEFVDGRWVTTQTKETLGQLLTRACSEQAGCDVDLNHVDS